MKLKSIQRVGWKLEELSIEIRIQKGTEKFEILGLPDMLIKESVLRVKSAIQSQGFSYPIGRTILVNLSPVSRKKNSFGTDLALAVGILIATKQLSPKIAEYTLYGQLSLEGDVISPEDIECMSFQPERKLITSKSSELFETPFIGLGALGDLREFDVLETNVTQFKVTQDLSEQSLSQEELSAKVTEEQARFIKLVAIGGHPVLFAGSPGSGKTTIAKFIGKLRPKAPPKLLKETFLLTKFYGEDYRGRPVISPHHSSTAISLVGGGATLRPGEITRAHGGTLVLDEYLEFEPKVLEALREPFQEGRIRISRNAGVISFPANCQILATTNLCPCGKWIPGKGLNCQYGIRKCRSHLERLSGPLLDRFQILYFLEHLEKGDKRTVAIGQIKQDIEKVKSTNSNQTDVENFRKPISEIRSLLDKKAQFEVEDLVGRRFEATLRVALTLSELRSKAEIGREEIIEAKKYTSTPFHRLMTPDFD
jgi:magnesium chelatase family protein